MIVPRMLGLGVALVAAPLLAEDPRPGTAEYVSASTDALLEIATARSEAAAAAALAAFADRNLDALRSHARSGDAEAARAAASAQLVFEKGLADLAERVAAGEDGALKDLVAAATSRHKTALQSLLDSGRLPEAALPAVQQALTTSMYGHQVATGVLNAPRGAGPESRRGPDGATPASPPSLPPQGPSAIPSLPSLPR